MKNTLILASAFALATALTGCGGDDSSKDASAPPASSTSPTEDAPSLCDQVDEALARFGQFGTAVSDPAAAGRAATQIVASLDKIESAPPEVQKAADNSSKIFGGAVKADGTFDMNKLVKIAGPAKADGEALAAYQKANC